ncbi:MAG TPA: amino acid permease [Gemmatimonadaceae bacterium]|nr:amino acid permease [Gemmatimonadaceae bacterium]
MDAPEPTTLPRQLGLWSAVAVVVGSTIGSGIFRTPAGVTNRLPGPLAVMSVWVAGGVLALCGALTLAEVGGAFPNTGGIFDFIRRAWGRLPAFLFGWAELSIIRAASLGAISTTFAEYFLRVLGFDVSVAPYSAWVHYVAAAAIVLTATFNYVGLRTGALVQNVTTVAKYFGLLFIVVLAISIGLPRTHGANFAPAAPPGSFAVSAFGLALVSVLWAYDGWADLTFVSGEIRDPRRNVPRALLLGTGAVIVLYLLANVGYLSVLSIDEVRTSKLVAADTAARLMGAAGVTFVSLTVMLSTFGTLNGSILTSPRVFFAMADEGMLFKRFRRVHPRFQTPYLAISLTAALGVVFVLLRTFEQLADTFVTAIIPFYALGVASIFVFRRRVDFDPSFRTPFYPLTPILFVLAIFYLLGNALIDPGSRWPTLAIFGVILTGIPVYYATVWRAKPETPVAP